MVDHAQHVNKQQGQRVDVASAQGIMARAFTLLLTKKDAVIQIILTERGYDLHTGTDRWNENA
jgi:hypothetical protein